MREQVVLGIDVGTSSTKIAGLEPNSDTVLFRETVQYRKEYVDRVGRAHYSRYTDALDRAVYRVEREMDLDIAAVAVSTQMYSLMNSAGFVDGWNSSRNLSGAVFNGWCERLSGSGAQPDSIFPVFSLLAEASPSAVGPDVGAELLPWGLKAVLLEHLCGTRIVDPAEASSTGMFDVERGRWIDLGFSERKLPEVVNHDVMIGPVTTARGYRSRFSVAPGLGDGVSASWRAAPVYRTAANLGTSTAARTIIEAPLGVWPVTEARKAGFWSFRMDDDRVVVGAISNAGFGIIERYRGEGLDVTGGLNPEDSPYFFPWIGGGRWPFWWRDLEPLVVGSEQAANGRAGTDDTATGDVYADLESLTGPQVWESVDFSTAWMIEAVAGFSGSTRCLVAGGGIHEPGFPEALASVQPVALEVPRHAEYFAAEGAALSAARSLGYNMELPVPVERTLEGTRELISKHEAGLNTRYSRWKELSKIYSRSGHRSGIQTGETDT